MTYNQTYAWRCAGEDVDTGTTLSSNTPTNAKVELVDGTKSTPLFVLQCAGVYATKSIILDVCTCDN